MPDGKNRKTDQFMWVKQVWVIVISAMILGGAGFVWRFPEVYAKKTELADAKEECESGSEKVEKKLDKIMGVLDQIDTRTQLLQNDMGHIRQGLTDEIERSKETDRVLAEDIRDLDK